VDAKIFCSPHSSRPALEAIQPPFQLVPGISLAQSHRGMALTTRHHLAPRLSVGGAIAMLPLCGSSGMLRGEG